MGQVETRSSSIRRSVSRWLMPPGDLKLLNEIESNWFGVVKKLEQAQGQVNELSQDTGQYKASTWGNLSQGDYNPEQISFTEYKKMLDYDSQVIAGFDLIQMGCLMKPWRIQHPDEEISKTITAALNELRWPNFRDIMKEMLKAIPYGFSVSEVVFDDYHQFWMPRLTNGIKTFDPETITFYTDSYGNLEKIGQKVETEVALPLERTLVWSHEKEYGNWYGKSLLRGCYKNWFIKDAMLKFSNIAYERFGSPVLLGIASNDKDMGTVLNAITHLYARSQAVLRKTDEHDPTDIKVIESKRAEMPFDRYIRYHDDMILRRMLIGQNLFSGGGGTYGPKVPMDILFMRFEDFRLELSSVMNDMLRLITDLNWPTNVYPKFEFAPLTTTDQDAIAQKVFSAIDRKLVHKSEPWIRDELGLPMIQPQYQAKIDEEAAAEQAVPSKPATNPNKTPEEGAA
jgi:phage gp29-like protein